MGKSISFLLGAGFSFPMGYPMGNDIEIRLNDIINRGIQAFEENPYNPVYSKYPFILQKMIDFYKRSHNGTFNYEDFYEYIPYCCKDKTIGNALNYYRYGEPKPIESEYLNYVDKYQEYISKLIKDANGIQFYEEHDTLQLNIYGSFIKELKKFLDEDFEVNIHTLNHDLLFESFKNSNLIGDKICDGFEYNLKKYIGYNDRNEIVGLPYFNEKYDKQIRLYKLHGSIDQYKYYKGDFYMEYDNHIKMEQSIDKGKELHIVENGEIIDTFRFVELQPDFLTGKESKEKNYHRPFYNKLFSLFENNMEHSDCLFIVGYSGNDNGINNRLLKYYSGNNKPCFIYDPKPCVELCDLAMKINAEVIKLPVENIVFPTNLNL